MSSTFKRPVLLGMAIALIAAACAGSDLDTADTAGAVETTSAPAARAVDERASDGADSDAISVAAADGEDLGAPPAAGDEVAAQQGGGEVITGVGTLTPTDIGRDIVFTAQLTIAADDVAAAAQAALDAVAPLGGLLFGQQTTTEPLARTVLTIKVLPEDFQEALSRLSGVGQLRSQDVMTDDVTERVVDLESRIITSETSVDRLRVLLEGAVGLDEVSAIERELLAREQSLEQLRGQLRTIRDAVGLATITMTIEQLPANTSLPSLEVISSFYVGDDNARGCPARNRTNIRQGDVVTACFEVTNTGGSAVGDIQIVDRKLGIDEVDLISLTPNSTLLPGETWIFASTFEATESLTTESRVTAIVAPDPNANGVDQGARRSGVNTVGVEAITVDDDDSLPGFAESVGGGFALLQLLIGILVVLVGLVIPFLWIPPLAAVIVWFGKRHNRNKGVSGPPDPVGSGQDAPGDAGSTPSEAQSST